MKKTPDSPALTPLPVRQKIVTERNFITSPPMARSVSFPTIYWRVLIQLIKWGIAGLLFSIYSFLGRIRGQSKAQRNGKNLRNLIEWMGGTAVKIGQQLSLRIDLLPYEFCVELGKMLDQRPPFPTSLAIKEIESSTGKKLAEIFTAFDPTPIGSASIACVYKAILPNGEPVAVKVRRPNIGKWFMADFKAIDILCGVLEFFTILRPGYTKTFRQGLKEVLLEELDFRIEARYQGIFRNRIKTKKVHFLGAPRVIHEISGESVLVMEFMEGIPLSEILEIVESKDDAGMAILQEQNINPRKIARRLLWVSHMAMISEPFFHSDPNPANVIIQENSKLIFIDFGSCGTFSHSQKRLLQEINYFQYKGDTEGMARATISMLNPLPPIDVDAFSLEIEKIYRASLYAMQDKNAVWWERTTAIHWISFMKIALKFKVPLPLGLIHMVRSTMLYDTISARLDPKIDFYEAFRRFERYAGKLARKRVKQQVKDAIVDGIDPKIYLRLEQMMDLGNRLIFRLQLLLDSNPTVFGSMVHKGYFFLSSFIRFAFAAFLITSLITGIDYVLNWEELNHVPIRDSIEKLFRNGWYQLFWGLNSLLYLRKVVFRMEDNDN